MYDIHIWSEDVRPLTYDGSGSSVDINGTEME